MAAAAAAAAADDAEETKHDLASLSFAKEKEEGKAWRTAPRNHTVVTSTAALGWREIYQAIVEAHK